MYEHSEHIHVDPDPWYSSPTGCFKLTHRLVFSLSPPRYLLIYYDLLLGILASLCLLFLLDIFLFTFINSRYFTYFGILAIVYHHTSYDLLLDILPIYYRHLLLHVFAGLSNPLSSSPLLMWSHSHSLFLTHTLLLSHSHSLSHTLSRPLIYSSPLGACPTVSFCAEISMRRRSTVTFPS